MSISLDDQSLSRIDLLIPVFRLLSAPELAFLLFAGKELARSAAGDDSNPKPPLRANLQTGEVYVTPSELAEIVSPPQPAAPFGIQEAVAVLQKLCGRTVRQELDGGIILRNWFESVSIPEEEPLTEQGGNLDEGELPPPSSPLRAIALRLAAKRSEAPCRPQVVTRFASALLPLLLSFGEVAAGAVPAEQLVTMRANSVRLYLFLILGLENATVTDKNRGTIRLRANVDAMRKALDARTSYGDSFDLRRFLLVPALAELNEVIPGLNATYQLTRRTAHDRGLTLATFEFSAQALIPPARPAKSALAGMRKALREKASFPPPLPPEVSIPSVAALPPEVRTPPVPSGSITPATQFTQAELLTQEETPATPAEGQERPEPAAPAGFQPWQPGQAMPEPKCAICTSPVEVDERDGSTRTEHNGPLGRVPICSDECAERWRDSRRQERQYNRQRQRPRGYINPERLKELEQGRAGSPRPKEPASASAPVPAVVKNLHPETAEERQRRKVGAQGLREFRMKFSGAVSG